jgi:hypothetical protein
VNPTLIDFMDQDLKNLTQPPPPTGRPPRNFRPQVAVKEPSKKPEGWWSLENLIGGREGVLKAVAASSAPDRWKNLFQAEIDALDAKLNHVELDAHYHVQGGKASLHYTLTASTVLD